jgi:hypothetical protein
VNAVSKFLSDSQTPSKHHLLSTSTGIKAVMAVNKIFYVLSLFLFINLLKCHIVCKIL